MPLLVHAFVSLEHLDVHVTLVSQATMQTLLDFAKHATVILSTLYHRTAPMECVHAFVVLWEQLAMDALLDITSP